MDMSGIKAIRGESPSGSNASGPSPPVATILDYWTLPGTAALRVNIGNYSKGDVRNRRF
jgi:hypothetical protein